jgi:tRNA(Arg) A34 adenosine deaminase TadA
MKNWNELDKGWKASFTNAWEAFKLNTVPIGCVIQNENDETVASGKNMAFNNKSNGMILFDNKLAHAEINTILLLNEKEHKNIRKYILYTTLEPCILCFGAIVMGNIRFLKYAARDRFGGATALNKMHEYTKSKNINIEGPIEQLEYIQICLLSYYELSNDSSDKSEKLLMEFAKDCKKGVLVARKLYENKILEKSCNKNMEYIFNKLMEES